MGQWADKSFHSERRASKKENIIKKTKSWCLDEEFVIIVSGFAMRKDGSKDTRLRSYGSGHDRVISKNFIPKYIAVRGKDSDRIIMCPMQLADCFFVGVGSADVTGPMSVDLYGIAVRGYNIYLGEGRSARYVYYDNYIVGVPRNAMAEFSLAIGEQHEYNMACASDIRNIDWKGMASVERLSRGLDFADTERKNALIRACAAVPVSKVTSQHHLHYSAVEVLTSGDGLRTAEVELLERLVAADDAHQSAIAGFALWFNTLSDELLELVASMSCWENESLTAMAKSIKQAVRAAKLLQNNTETDLLPVFEAEVLLNRGIGAVDWQAERENRIKPDVAKLSDSKVYQRAVTIMQQGKHDRGRYPKMSWKEYWGMRWQFTPTGSIKSQYPEDLQGMPADFRLKNKFVAVNTTSKVSFEDWVCTEPSIHAWSSVKYEWGKERAIYGCDVTNFLITNFAMFQCEDRLPPRFPVGSRAEPAYVTRAIDNILEGREPYCFDFEDFNSQHSTGAMRSVLRAFADVYSPDMSEEQRAAMAWVVKSVDNMVVHDNIGGTGTYKANGTLFSGWRLTTFMNSVLNAIYSEEIYEPTEAQHTMSSAHNGDDIILGIVNAKQATGMLKNALDVNVRAQPAKCAFGAVAEFLRVDRQGGSTAQYLPRAIATLVHSRIESGPSTALADSIRSNETRLSEFVDRGGALSTALKLRQLYLKRVAGAYGNTLNDALTILESSSVVGGLSMSRDAPVDKTIKQLYEEETDETMIVLEGDRAWRGIADMANNVLEVVGHAIGSKVTIKDITKRLYNSTLNALSIRRKKVNITDTLLRSRALNWREHRGTFKNLRASGTLGMARLAGVAIDLRSTHNEDMNLLLHKAAESSEPMTFISIAT